jgi:N-acetylglucosaminyldiphosphoundecaprenol N-acetyl-beta-D-mannosaminyltransferase
MGGGRVRREADVLDRPGRVRLGRLEVDRVTFAGAVDAIEQLVRNGRGGAVFTPNVDHVVLAEEDAEFSASYSRASLSLADGMPVVWASRILGRAVPQKASGSDLIGPVMERAARNGWRVYLLGAAPIVADKAASVLRGRGVNVVGVDSPAVRDPRSASERHPIVEKVRRSRADLVLVAFGAPKQELFIDAARPETGGAVLLGVGASLDFVAGAVPRAPRWMSDHGLEWLYRLVREPRRLWRRYLLRDPKFVRIVWRTFREQRRSAARTLTGTRPVLLQPRAAAPS